MPSLANVSSASSSHLSTQVHSPVESAHLFTRSCVYMPVNFDTLLFDLKTLSCAYAEHLVEQQQAEQAGLLLWRCGEPARALQAFATSSSWRNAICVAQQIPLPPDQLALLARDLAGNHKNRWSCDLEIKWKVKKPHRCWIIFPVNVSALFLCREAE